ncbi:MAG: tetratricopeptide repeat protein [bacterium]|nr:tetratricopeptide repeat protein [bacterium]
MGFGILIMCAYQYIIKKKETLKAPLLAALIIVICLYSYATIDRNRIWSSEKTIWADTIEKAPDNKYAHNNLGILVTWEGDIKRGITLFRRALAIDPMHHPARNNLGAALAKSGRIKEAAEEFSLVLKYDPTNPDARRNLKQALTILND